LALHGEHRERLVRHPLPEVHRDDLRDPLGAGRGLRDRARLCRGRRHEVRAARPHHPRDSLVLRAGHDPASVLDGGLHAADGDHVQPVRLHRRDLGEELGADAARADADRDADDLPRRRVLLDRHAAAGLAHGHAVQPGRVPDQRLPLELLRDVRRRRRHEPPDDALLHARLRRRHRMDVPDRVPPEAVIGPGSVSPVTIRASRAAIHSPGQGGRMMPGKRALVVDDSKSARVVLARMLEKYGILVDSADSAEAALEYLKDRRPDVIFMDHLMPGMDGLQAVREIKAKPDLAAIPIMMYTSQEGEIYGGQARASGAVGVLPKSIRPIDVTKALYQLQLLPDRRDMEPSLLEPVGEAPARATAAAAPAEASVEALLKEQNLEMRRFVVTTLDAWTHRIVAELRPRESSVVVEGEEESPQSAPRPRTWPWKLATAAAAVALVALGALYWQARVAQEQSERAFQAVESSNKILRSAIEKWRIAGETSADAAAQEGFRPLVLAVPFGEQALSPARLEAVRGLVAQLE